MFSISYPWTSEDRKIIGEFLQHAKALLATGELKVEPTSKNTKFKQKYPLRHKEIVKLLKSLQVEDCIDYGPNNNPKYPDATVFKFIKTCELSSFGEIQEVCLYIKEYIIEKGSFETVCVISLHEEGMYD